LHLGVTEAGEAEDGRIKSAVGIGTLIEDGLGDTIRVSLTEEPEEEIPVARALVKRYAHRKGHPFIADVKETPVNPFEFNRRKTFRVGRIGGIQVPVVLADIRGVKLPAEQDLECAGYDYSSQDKRYLPADRVADFIFISELPDFSLPAELGVIIDHSLWQGKKGLEKIYPAINIAEVENGIKWHPEMNFITVSWPEMNEQRWKWLSDKSNLVLLLSTSNPHGMAEMRRFFFELINRDIEIPVIISPGYPGMDSEEVLLYASTDAGGLLVDGLGDGIMIRGDNPFSDEALNCCFLNDLSFGILQAAGARITKTEYISCPSCGRTLFNLQETTARIRERTGHLKGIKIGIMGCIVNGPGEMADADYGYVGSGTGKITLYRGKEVVKRSVPESEAVDRLIEIIKEDGKWTD
jgi:(E)-4-hydroxy-3-methylbut-2-enyl-diphosphate synthase